MDAANREIRHTLQDNPLYLTQLQAAIQQLHNCDSRHLETVEVTETFQGKVIWHGKVEVFEIREHPKARVCYAWKYKEKESKTERIAAIPGLRLIRSPADAVKTFIMAENRKHIF
jgi:hypothetical protein